jgi:hypothetical protein
MKLLDQYEAACKVRRPASPAGSVELDGQRKVSGPFLTLPKQPPGKKGRQDPFALATPGAAKAAGNAAVDLGVGALESAGAGLVVTGGAAAVGTTVTVGDTAVTTVAGATGVGGAVILVGAGGYAVGNGIGQIQVGNNTIHGHIGNKLYAIAPKFWNWVFN